MGKKIKQALTIMADKNAEFWGVAQVSTPSYRMEQDLINQLVNQRLDNIKLCYNKLYVFKSPMIIEELDNA